MFQLRPTVSKFQLRNTVSMFQLRNTVSMFQAGELERLEQEITVSLQDVGLSLVNNYTQKEVAFLGITRSVSKACIINMCLG